MSDRVIRQPGRPDEVRTIERVFRSFVIAKKTELTIARELNEEGILNEFGRPWRVPSIQRMLTCEKYIGNLVYNQKSGKFRRRRQPNPPDQWIRVNNAFEAVVDPELFERAQKIFARRPDRLVRLWPSNDEILARLRELREQRGHLSCVIIDNADGMPHSCIYRARFGSLRKAFELIGYDTRSCNSFDGRRAAVATVGRLQSELAAEIQRSGTYAEFVKPTTHRSRAIVTVNKSLTISVYIARCFRIPRGALRWYVRRHITRDADMILFIRMDQNNTGILDYYLMPSEKIVDGRISFWERSRAKLERYRSCDVTGLIAPIKTRLTTKAQRVRQNAGSDGKREVGE
jgi:hypothetical protein